MQERERERERQRGTASNKDTDGESGDQRCCSLLTRVSEGAGKTRRATGGKEAPFSHEETSYGATWEGMLRTSLKGRNRIRKVLVFFPAIRNSE